MRAKPAFRQFKMNLATDLHERIKRLKKETGLTSEALK